MYLEFTEEQRNLRVGSRVFRGLVADVEGSAQNGPTYTRYIRRMGHDGWLGLGWPLEYGGQGRGPIDGIEFVEESHWAGVPLPLLTLNERFGPTLMALGTDKQRQQFLPGILRGTVHFSIGYTEPSAGTDLASLKTRAVHDGDEYVINGQKIFTRPRSSMPITSGWPPGPIPMLPSTRVFRCSSCPSIFRGSIGTHCPPPQATSPAPRSSRTSGFPSRTLSAQNQGWKMITNQLNHERVAICPASGLLRSVPTCVDGRRDID